MRAVLRILRDIVLRSPACRACGSVRWAWQACPCRGLGTGGYARGMYPCCRDSSHREVIEFRTEDDPAALARLWWISQQFVAWGWRRYPQRPHTKVERCRMCGRRHFHAYMGHLLQPGKIGVR